MKRAHSLAILWSALAAGGCTAGHGCEALGRADALRLALEQKRGMLSRSTDAYAANFRSDAPVFVKIGAETNGYAANVGFRGRDGRTLIALIERDCYVSWTER